MVTVSSQGDVTDVTNMEARNNGTQQRRHWRADVHVEVRLYAQDLSGTGVTLAVVDTEERATRHVIPLRRHHEYEKTSDQG